MAIGTNAGRVAGGGGWESKEITQEGTKKKSKGERRRRELTKTKGNSLTLTETEDTDTPQDAVANSYCLRSLYIMLLIRLTNYQINEQLQLQGESKSKSASLAMPMPK